MTNRSKQRGTAFETLIVDWLKLNGFPYAERRALHGSKDLGDINIPGVTLELKNCKTMTLAAWLDEAKVEAANAGTEVYAVVHKRRGKGDPGEQYVTLPLAVFARLIR